MPNQQVKINSVGLKQAFMNMMNWLWSGTTWVKQKCETTGEASNVNYGKQTGGTITAFRTESTGEQTTSVHGDAAGTITSLKVETTGEADVVLHGKDSGGNIDPLRTNASQQLQVEVFGSDGAYVEVPQVALTTSEANLWSPGTTAADYYLVEFKIIHITVAGSIDRNPSNAFVGQGIGGAAIVRPNHWMYAYPVAYPGGTEWEGPFLIPGNDTVRGKASLTNTLDIQFRVRKASVESA